MKNLFIVLVLTLFTVTTAHSQARNFDGIWSGNLTTSSGDDLDLTLYIEDNNVYSVYIDEDGDRAKYKQYEVLWSKGYGQQLNFVWMNKGGVWTETQMYSLSWVNPQRISVHHMRHVTNEDKEETNTDWGYTSTGFLSKE